MLRITRIAQPDAVTLKLEGTLMEAWTPELESACRAARATSGPRRTFACLDLAAVSYVDAAGVRLLHDLVRDGVRIVACSSFVAQLLSLEKT